MLPAPLRAAIALGLLGSFASAVPSAHAALPTDFQDQLVVGGLSTPTSFAFLPDSRCFVTEQLTARIRLIVNGALSVTDPVCVVPNVRTNSFYQGLTGIAVDPRWPASPYLYVHYPTSTGKVLLSRFTAAGDLAFTGNGAITVNTATRYDILTDLYDAGHNGGTLRFGLDQMLYASVGDSDHVHCSAQHIGSLRGVILRLDIRSLPAGAGGPPAKTLLVPADNPFVGNTDVNARLVWARGLRNPFRFHLDAPTGDVFIADVGEDTWEEVDRVSTPGPNFGWPLFEGPDPFLSCPGAPGTGLSAPIYYYGHASPSESIIGAGVYRRPSPGPNRFPPEYEGDYFFSDFYSGSLRRLKGSGTSWSIAPSVPGQPNATDWATGMDEVSDYLPANDGSLWYCRQGVAFAANTGQIRRIVYTGIVGVGEAPTSGVEFSAPRPMPAHGEVALEYRLPAPARIELAILDVSGRRVRRLDPRGEQSAGVHEATWDMRDDDGRKTATGVYFARLAAAGTSIVRRVVVFH